jgi:hypothetical protein
MSDEAFMYTHDSKIDGGCGGIAFLLNRRPTHGQVIKAEDFLPVNGIAPKPGDIMRCGSCNKLFPSGYIFPLVHISKYEY